ncbi:HK97 family phage prohead protease [Undibacterium sp. MH2W]|uniref:HK97 family phage prohead protease n=1 Tax=Undibacterium sp. MH2W TaxID=3413044 RepID=UPI003BF1BB52
MNLLDTHLEIKSVSDNGMFAGMGSVYSVVDQGDDIVAPGAFADSLKSWSEKGRMPALLWQHNQREPIGAYTKMQETDAGLYVEGQLCLKTQRGAEAYELMKMGALSGLSIGFITRDYSVDQKTGVRTIKAADLMEVSPVTFPMNDDARIQVVKSIEQITDYKSAETYLRESGLSKSAATAIVGRIKALVRSESDVPDMKAVLEALEQRAKIFTQP